MKEQLISIGIAVVLAIVGALFSTKYSDYITIKDSIYIGIFSYLVSLMIFISERFKLIDSIGTINKNVSYVSAYILSEEKAKRIGNDSASILWAISMFRAKEGVYKLIDSNTFEVEREQIPGFWQQAIINADVSWFCTNNVNSPEDLGSGWARRGFELQSMSSKDVGTTVKRLFIYENKEEITPDVIKQMKWHQSLGFMVKFLTKDVKLTWSPFLALEKLIGTTDIAIINGAYLIAFLLSSEKLRTISRLRCYGDMDLVRRINELFTRLWELGNVLDKLENNKNTLIP